VKRLAGEGRKSSSQWATNFGLGTDRLCHDSSSSKQVLCQTPWRAAGGGKDSQMKQLISIPLALSLSFLSACTHNLSMRSSDGERWNGEYRFARENTGLIRVRAEDGEVLMGKFITVGRWTFVESYKNTFGIGSIATESPDASAYGNLFAGALGGFRTPTDFAFTEPFDSASGNSETAIRGPLFYWTASLQGDRGATMGCYFIGSSYTGHGFGRCKSHTGKEYTVQF
jgi:hypothetical protein